MVRNTRREGSYTWEVFSEELGGTVACGIRGITNTSAFKHHTREKDIDNNEEMEEPEELFSYLGYSEFGSIKICINIRKSGYHSWLIVKTDHARSLKKT